MIFRLTLLQCILFVSIKFNVVFAQSTLPELEVDQAGIRIARKTESLAVTGKDSSLLGKAYFLYGTAYKKAGNFNKASEYFLKSIQILEGRLDCDELGRSYLFLNEGIIINNKSRQDFENGYKALSVFRRLGDNAGMALTYNYLTSAYKRNWVWDAEQLPHTVRDAERLDTLFQCISLVSTYGKLARDTAMMAEAHVQRADLYRHMNQQKAIQELGKAQYLFELKADTNSIIHTLCHKASAHMKFRQNRLAVAAIRRAEKLLSLIGSKDYWAESHTAETARDVYVQARLWQDAYRSADYLNGLYSFRRKGDRDNLIESFHIRAEAEKKEAELVAQRIEVEKARAQKYLTWTISALLGLTVVTSIVFFFLYRKNRAISIRNGDLVREQNHRVKNNLQVVSSLLNLQSQQLTDPESRRLINESQLRIESMAILHRRLYDGDKLAQVNLANFIPEIVQSVFQTFGNSHVEPTYRISDIFLTADKATPLGLIINELASNACKYAFPNVTNPTFELDGVETESGIELVIKDNGPGFKTMDLSADFPSKVFANNTATFGISLIQSQLIQLQAKGFYNSLKDGRKGLVFKMAFRN